MLGGSLYQTYAIKEAVAMGHYVITCDYLPTNPGHKYSHEYYNISTTDREAVLELARQHKVDGVVAYASDPAAPVAAYVSEQLGLPTSPYKSVEILSNKDLFRDFLAANGFNTPVAMGFASYEEAYANKDKFRLPVMVKPVDSSGSKGINKLTSWEQLEAFVADALSYSRSGRIIIEEFINKKGWQISGDAFSVDGVLKFHCFGNEYYNPSGKKDFAPLGECWPFMMDPKLIDRLHQDLQRLISLLGMKTTAYNVEAIVDENDNIFILELGARSGGSLIPQVTAYATGVDMVPYVIKGALGEDCSDIEMLPVKGCWANYMVHSKQTGLYDSTWFEEDFRKNHLVESVTELKQGDSVHEFRDAQDALGELILKFDTTEQMLDILSNMDKYIKIQVL
ncbi:MAG: ATP-grasp domain-containing protein [Muribaculaceae bacterium]|nr:ATP-grasp domain-containing protein [Muribaculaceae bacterium]